MVLCRIGRRVCALPLENVIETMRPLSVERLLDMPPFVLGVTVVRGTPAPVIDAASLLEGVGVSPERFVSLDVRGRRVVLAVSEVAGVRRLPDDAFAASPPLLGHVADGVVAAIGSLDSELVLVLRTMRLVPDEVWSALEGRANA